MPQNDYLTLFQSTYPILAPVQKPPGVTVSTTATAPRVPNKFVYAAGTIQMVEAGPLEQAIKDAVVDRVQEAVEERQQVQEPEEPTEEDEPHRGGRGRRR